MKLTDQNIELTLANIFEKVKRNEGKEINDFIINDKFCLFFDDDFIWWVSPINKAYDKNWCPHITKQQAELLKEFTDILKHFEIPFTINTDLFVD